MLSVVYVETARRAGVALDGVGLSGHYVVGRSVLVRRRSCWIRSRRPPIVAPVPSEVRPWAAHETALRMLNNLVDSYTRRNDLGRAIRAAEMRLELSLERALREALGGGAARAPRAPELAG